VFYGSVVHEAILDKCLCSNCVEVSPDQLIQIRNTSRYLPQLSLNVIIHANRLTGIFCVYHTSLSV